MFSFQGHSSHKWGSTQIRKKRRLWCSVWEWVRMGANGCSVFWLRVASVQVHGSVSRTWRASGPVWPPPGPPPPHTAGALATPGSTGPPHTHPLRGWQIWVITSQMLPSFLSTFRCYSEVSWSSRLLPCQSY